jgi:hypothetical protein
MNNLWGTFKSGEDDFDEELMTPLLRSTTEIFSKIDLDTWINADVVSIEHAPIEYIRNNFRL